MKAMEVTAGLAESNGSLLPVYGVIHFTSPAACTPGSAPGPTLGNRSMGKLYLFTFRRHLGFAVRLKKGFLGMHACVGADIRKGQICCICGL